MLGNVNPDFSHIFNPITQRTASFRPTVDSIQTESSISNKSCYFPDRTNNGKSNLTLNQMATNEVCSKASGYQNADFFAKKIKEYIENVS
jgi:hypothetical protein